MNGMKMSIAFLNFCFILYIIKCQKPNKVTPCCTLLLVP